MNRILQWQPGKSRLLANAKIENIHRIREDLKILAEWIQTKADAAWLPTKADASLVDGLQKAVSDLRSQIQALSGQVQSVATEGREQAARLQEANQEADLILAQCREIETKLGEAEHEFRTFANESLAKATEQAANLRRLADEAKAAADQVGSDKQTCVELSQSIRTALDENQQRMHGFMRDTEAQAVAARQSAQETAAAAERAGALKAECEDLLRTLQLKSEELSASTLAAEKVTTPPAESGFSMPTPKPAEASTPDPRLAAIEAKLRALIGAGEARSRAAEEEIAEFREKTDTFWGRMRWLLFGDGSG